MVFSKLLLQRNNIIRTLIGLLLVVEIVHSWGLLEDRNIALDDAKKESMGELEAKFVRITSEVEAKLFIGSLLYAQEQAASGKDGAALEAQVRPVVATALRDPAEGQKGSALAWCLRYQIAIGVFFDLEAKSESFLKALQEHPSKLEVEQRIDRALERVLHKQPLESEDLLLLSREMGTAGRALVIKAGGTPEEAKKLRQEILISFYWIILIGAVLGVALLCGLFFTLFYGVVLFFGFARWRFIPATFDSECLLWTWGIYLTLMFGSGFLLRDILKVESIMTMLWANLVLILGMLFLLVVPLLAGVSWAALRQTIGLQVRGVGSLLKDICLGPTFYLATLIPIFSFMLLFSLLLSLFKVDMSGAAHPIVFMLMRPGEKGVFVFTLVLAVVVAPLVEEIMFRGLLYTWLRQRAGVAISVVLTSLVFALIHPQGPIGVPLLFLIGAALAILREWRGSLVAPVLCHACVNGGTLLLLTMLLHHS